MDYYRPEQGEEAEAAAGGTGEGQGQTAWWVAAPRGQASASLGTVARKCTEAETRPRRAQNCLDREIRTPVGRGSGGHAEYQSYSVY